MTTATETNLIGLTVQPFNLADDDLLNLSRGFVSRELAEAAKLRRVSDEIGAEITGRHRKAGFEYSGLVYPYFLPTDYTKPRQYRLRRDKPDIERNGDGKEKETAKYLSAPGAGNSFYFPPNIKPEWLKDSSLPVVLTEGEKKGLALARLASENLTLDRWRFLPVALSGVWNFKSSNIGKTTRPNGEWANVKGTIPDFEFIQWKGRDVYILFDANVQTNSAVITARFWLAETLRKKSATVFFAELPDGCGVNGIDDYLGKIESEYDTKEAIGRGLEIIETARAFTKTKTSAASNFELITDTDKPGVYFTDDNGEKSFICSPLEILAETQTENGTNYGKLLKWKDTKNRAHQWAMLDKLIHAEGGEILQRLSDEGLRITPNRKAYERLRAYISFSTPDRTIICTEKIGWHGSDAYVLPNQTFGGTDEIIYQSANEGFHKFNTKGTLSDWQENVSRYCVNNSRLAFAVSVAFACPLLPVVDLTGGGFHFRGITSTGKTTVLLVAGSVFGGSSDSHGFCQTWKATANGLESVAESHNHALLCLDEIGECDSRQVGEIAYMLANGHGKNRMARNVSARRSLTWDLLFLSSGEQRLSDKMREGGQTIKGGQEIRLCDIEADTQKHGLFENLHGFRSGQEFSDFLRRASKDYYGSPIRAFLEWLVKVDREAIRRNWREFQQKFITEVLKDKENVPSEVFRAASRFALVALAGELATESGATGWMHGTATAAAKEIFQNWLSNREGSGGSDAENAIRQVRHFLEQHGQSRFQSLDAGEFPARIQNRAGFKRTTYEETEYLILPEVFRAEVCKGYDMKTVARALLERGFLGRDGEKLQKQARCGEMGQIRVYLINSKIFESETAKAADA